MTTAVTNPGTNAFIQRMKDRQRTFARQTPQPTVVRMNGNTGLFSFETWNPETKESVETNVGPEFTGTILAVHYCCQSKFKEGSRKMFKTKEFSNFQNDPVVLQCIDQDADPKVSIIAQYENYKAFKKARTQIDPDTGEETYNYNLVAFLYVYFENQNKVVCLQTKISGNNGLFDYFKTYSSNTGAEAMVQVKTNFFSDAFVSQTLKDKNGKPVEGFALRFKTIGLNTEGDLLRLEEMVNQLDQWFATQEIVTATVIENTSPEPPQLPIQIKDQGIVADKVSTSDMNEKTIYGSDPIDVSQIPF